MRNMRVQVLRYRFLAWTLVALLFGAGEVLHQSLIHHSLDDDHAPACSVCKMSEHNLGDLSPAVFTLEAVDVRVWSIESPAFAGIVSPVCCDLTPRAPPRV